MIRDHRKIDNIENEQKIKRAILSAINSSWGMDNAISAENLQNHVIFVTGNKKITNRQIRNCIKELRDEGHLICSLSGTLKKQNISYSDDLDEMPSTITSGYYKPATLEEYKKYRSFHVSYAKNIYNTIRAMDRAANEAFPYDLQPGLFDDLVEVA